jgi:hypothetical protein
MSMDLCSSSPARGSSSSATPPPLPGSEEVPQRFGAPQGPAVYPSPFGDPVAPPPPSDDAEGLEAPPNWAGRFSTEIFGWSGYPPPYQGMDGNLHIHIYLFTISSVSLLLYLISWFFYRRELAPWRTDVGLVAGTVIDSCFSFRTFLDA